MKRPTKHASIQSRFTKINSVRLHYLAAGQGEPVILLHGYAQNSRMWRPLIAELAKTRTVIAPDLRGFGQSAKPPGGYDKKTMAQDIHALMGSLGFEKIGICGHDIGLMVAYAYAAQYPDEVDPRSPVFHSLRRPGLLWRPPDRASHGQLPPERLLAS